METSLSQFMKMAIKVVTIAALIFIVGYKMLEDESDEYKTHIETHKNDALR